MPKPWAKLEQNYINHPKFLALSANAICLWHEGKNYCDMHQTDGLIPKTALLTFRWRSARAIELLTQSCGFKPNSQPYAPLWERLDIGGVAYFRMHDYLLHNDCRDEVLTRIEDAEDMAELRRMANAERQRKFRSERKTKLAEARNTRNALRNAESNVTSHPPTETATETETLSLVKEPLKREKSAAVSLSPAALSDPFTDPTITERAGRFIERYQALYPTHRRGAQYAVRPMRDYAAAVTLCQTWTDDGRLDKLAAIFLTTDHRFAEEGSRTIPQFLALASWCDGKLAEWESRKAAV